MYDVSNLDGDDFFYASQKECVNQLLGRIRVRMQPFQDAAIEGQQGSFFQGTLDGAQPCMVEVDIGSARLRGFKTRFGALCEGLTTVTRKLLQ